MRRRSVIVAAVLLAFVVMAYLVIRHIDSPRLVAYAKASDGTEFCVVQKCNWDLEFFTTCCYYRKPGGRWGWFYFDHEDWYWGRGRPEVDTIAKQIRIYRGTSVRATFDWETETFQLLRPDFPHRKFVGAQQVAGWERPWK